MKNICIIGGSATSTTIKALKNFKKVDISDIVSVFDSGGSTGILRKTFRIYALGDLRDAMIAGARNSAAARLFDKRIRIRGVDHSIGNLFLLHLIRLYGKDYIKHAEDSLKIQKNIHVLPVDDNIRYNGNLVISTARGTLIGEHTLDEGSNIKVKGIRLSKPAKLNPAARKAILDANFIIFGPGDLYSSILPNTLVSGFKEAIYNSNAKKILIVNIMNKVNETEGFKVSDFIKVFRKHGIWIENTIVNTKEEKTKSAKAKYGKLSGFIKNDWFSKDSIEADLINKDIIYEHDPQKLGLALRRALK
jgi:uncharacterized cofD-like protein